MLKAKLSFFGSVNYYMRFRFCVTNVIPFNKNKLFYSAAAQAFYNAEKPEYVGNWQTVFQFQIIF
ncbi:hypothetical protein BOW57_04825 [Flavobacterium sp. YO64]|nr:hypothetical protein BOW57_04825 [Flavobacterium sp. YO64]